MKHEVTLIRARLKTPRAAGILFSVTGRRGRFILDSSDLRDHCIAASPRRLHHEGGGDMGKDGKVVVDGSRALKAGRKRRLAVCTSPEKTGHAGCRFLMLVRVVF